MRIKIEGPVTPERVKEAFNKVYKKYVESNFIDTETGEKVDIHISSVNMYITLKDSSGRILEPKNSKLND